MKGIRRIEARDRKGIGDLLASTGAFQPHELTVAMELVDTALTRPDQQDYHPYVVEEAGSLVAYACFGLNPMTRFTYDLYWIAVDANTQGKGVGKELLYKIEEELRVEGGRLLIIETSSQETYGNTIRFYERTGYALSARIKDFYKPDDDKLIFTKEFP